MKGFCFFINVLYCNFLLHFYCTSHTDHYVFYYSCLFFLLFMVWGCHNRHIAVDIFSFPVLQTIHSYIVYTVTVWVYSGSEGSWRQSCCPSTNGMTSSHKKATLLYMVSDTTYYIREIKLFMYLFICLYLCVFTFCIFSLNSYRFTILRIFTFCFLNIKSRVAVNHPSLKLGLV